MSDKETSVSYAPSPPPVDELQRGGSVEYLHHSGQPITAQALVQHLDEHPEMYHQGLHEPIRKLLGESAAESMRQADEAPYGMLPNGKSRTRPPLSDNDIENFYEYLEKCRIETEYDDNGNVIGDTQPDSPIPLDIESFCDLYNRDIKRGSLNVPDDDEWGGEPLVAEFLTVTTLDKAQQQEVANFLMSGLLEGDYDDLSFPLSYKLSEARFSSSIADQIIDMNSQKRGDYCDEIIQNIHKFDGVDINKLAQAALENNHDGPRLFKQDTLKFVLQHAGEIDRQAAVEKLYAAGFSGVEFLVKHADTFPEAGADRLAREALRQDLSGRLASNLFRFREMSSDTLELISNDSGFKVRNFPHDASEKIRNKWFADHAVTYLEGGFSKDLIGKVIRLRIENGIETDLHDASQWLRKFAIPGEAYDVSYIKAHREDPDFDTELVSVEKLKDPNYETYFILGLLSANAELRERLNLTDRPERILQLFSSPLHQIAYAALVSKNADGQPFYRERDLSMDKLAEKVQELGVDYFAQYSGLGRDKLDVTSNGRLDSFNHFLGDRFVLDGLFKYDSIKISYLGEPLTERINRLKELGLKRKAYTDDAATWLVRHATSPHHTLTQVWNDRPMALANGVERNKDGVIISELKDSASAIATWQKEKGLRKLLETEDAQNKLAEAGIEADEILGPSGRSWRQELSRVMGAEDTLTVFLMRHEWEKDRNWSEKVLEQAKVDFSLDENTKTRWRFEVLGADDPRGFTVGEDTGCCMTLEGVSEDCIRAGYKRENAGFVALYGDDGRLNAQSFWYIHPKRPDVLVLDNIEANEGRNFEKITDAYKRGLEQVIAQHNTAHPDRPIKRVHVGEGYTDINISHLAKVSSPVPPLDNDIYTDATRQRILFEL